MNGDILELIKLAQAGDEKATETIIEENSGLIWSVVRRFLNRGYDAEDLYQIGSIGLLKCIKKFDINYDVKFSTYAVPMIMGEIKRFLRDDGLIKISRPLKEIATKAKYMRDVLTKKNDEEPTINELAIAIDVSVEDLVLALDADRDVESLYSTVYQNDGKSVYLIDKLELKNDNQENIVDNIVLKDIIESLEPREKDIITLRYFEDKTQSQVAKIIGVSQVQVSRIEKKVLAKIREKFG
nr:RNA polymerase sporulation sigma factor SigF [uncultured Tyzzerella sp.]